MIITVELSSAVSSSPLCSILIVFLQEYKNDILNLNCKLRNVCDYLASKFLTFIESLHNAIFLTRLETSFEQHRIGNGNYIQRQGTFRHGLQTSLQYDEHDLPMKKQA